MRLPEHNIVSDVRNDKWSKLISSVWPWNEIDTLKRDVGFEGMFKEGESCYDTRFAPRLVTGLHEVFLRVTEMAAASNRQLPIETSMEFAQEYRNVIRNVAEAMSQEQASNSQQSNTFADAVFFGNILWGLVESILIRPQSRSVIADLMDWANNTFDQARDYLRQVEQMATSSSRVEDQDIFWTAVVSQLLVGQFRTASMIIQLSSDYRKNTNLQRIVHLIELFDLEQLHQDSTAAKFHHAQQQIQKYQSSFASSEPLTFICKLLLGDLHTFQQASISMSREWYEIFPAFLLFSKPDGDVSDLSHYAMTIFKAVNSQCDITNNLLNRVIISLLRMEWIQAMRDLSSLSSLLWLVVHLFDLIINTDSSIINEEIENIRNEVFIAYSKQLFRTPGGTKLLHPAVTYGRSAKDVKQDFIESYLIIIAENDGPNPLLAQSLLEVCNLYGYYEASSQISQAMACLALKKRNWSMTLLWAIRNETVEIMNVFANFVLNNAPASELRDLSLFNSLDENIQQSDAMLFLYHFHQFNIAMDKGDIHECVRLLHDLIINNLAPPEFTHILFDNMANALDAVMRSMDKKPLLTTEAIVGLQRAVALYEEQEAIRAEGSSQQTNRIAQTASNRKYLHFVLNNALALSVL